MANQFTIYDLDSPLGAAFRAWDNIKERERIRKQDEEARKQREKQNQLADLQMEQLRQQIADQDARRTIAASTAGGMASPDALARYIAAGGNPADLVAPARAGAAAALSMDQALRASPAVQETIAHDQAAALPAYNVEEATATLAALPPPPNTGPHPPAAAPPPPEAIAAAKAIMMPETDASVAAQMRQAVLDEVGTPHADNYAQFTPILPPPKEQKLYTLGKDDTLVKPDGTVVGKGSAAADPAAASEGNLPIAGVTAATPVSDIIAAAPQFNLYDAVDIAASQVESGKPYNDWVLPTQKEYTERSNRMTDKAAVILATKDQLVEKLNKGKIEAPQVVTELQYLHTLMKDGSLSGNPDQKVVDALIAEQGHLGEKIVEKFLTGITGKLSPERTQGIIASLDNLVQISNRAIDEVLRQSRANLASAYIRIPIKIDGRELSPTERRELVEAAFSQRYATAQPDSAPPPDLTQIAAATPAIPAATPLAAQTSAAPATPAPDAAATLAATGGADPLANLPAAVEQNPAAAAQTPAAPAVPATQTPAAPLANPGEMKKAAQLRARLGDYTTATELYNTLAWDDAAGGIAFSPEVSEMLASDNNYTIFNGRPGTRGKKTRDTQKQMTAVSVVQDLLKNDEDGAEDTIQSITMLSGGRGAVVKMLAKSSDAEGTIYPEGNVALYIPPSAMETAAALQQVKKDDPQRRAELIGQFAAAVKFFSDLGNEQYDPNPMSLGEILGDQLKAMQAELLKQADDARNAALYPDP